MKETENVDSQELKFIEEIEKKYKVKCRYVTKLNWRSDSIGKGKETNPRILLVLKNSKIAEFAMSGVRMKEFIEFPSYLTELREISMIKCQLEVFPESICGLTNCESIVLSYNEICNISKDIGKMKNLKTFDITQNLIENIPDELIGLPNLKRIEIKGNPIKNLQKTYPNLKNIMEIYKKKGLKDAEAEVIATLEIMTGRNINQVFHRGIMNGFFIQNSSIVWLRLSSENLKSLPENISNLNKLRTLNLAGEPAREDEGILGQRNNIQYLPESIGKLKSLKWLYLSKCMLKSIPKEIGQLVNLQQLFISNNYLEEIPNEFENLKALRVLDIQKNKLLKYPSCLDKLVNLEKLNLDNNLIEEIGYGIENLVNLKVIKLHDNQLFKLPDNLGKLEKLQLLDVSDNDLTSDSIAAIYNLKNLTHLNISNNDNISYLDEKIGTLSKLVYLNIEGNQFISIPTAIWKLNELKELYLRNNPWDENNESLIYRDLEYILEHCRKSATIHVFLSHAVEDYEKYNMIEFIKLLEKKPEIYEVLYCERDLTGNIDKFMAENVPKSNLLLFFATKKSVFDSDGCATELQLARKNKIEIIPILSKEIKWEDLNEIGIGRQLGKDYNENLEKFTDDLYEYIKIFKRKINLYEKDKAKIDKILYEFQKVFDKAMKSDNVKNYILQNFDEINRKSLKENSEESILKILKAIL